MLEAENKTAVKHANWIEDIDDLWVKLSNMRIDKEFG